MYVVRFLRVLSELSKSGIVCLVLISVLSGYLIGESGEIQIKILLFALLGVFLLASGASALNQYQERWIDAKMFRTAGRPLPTGRIHPRWVQAWVVFALCTGLGLLAFLQPILFYLGLIAVITYNGFYTLWWKKRWSHAAIPGAIPGALPVWMGYLAAHHGLSDVAGLYLFCLVFCWQMPHSWILALHYSEDYVRGGFPVLPVVFGVQKTLQKITLWGIAYVVIALLAPLFLSVGWLYWIPAFLMSLRLAQLLIKFIRGPQQQYWLSFFLWINVSLVFYLGFAVLDSRKAVLILFLDHLF